MGQNYDLEERLWTFAPIVSEVTLQAFFFFFFGKIWKLEPLGRPLVKKTEAKPQKDRTQVLVARQSKAPFGRTTVKKTDS